MTLRPVTGYNKLIGMLSSRLATSPSGVTRVTGSAAASKRQMITKPKLIALDLDGTLWWPEMYMMSGAPYKRDPRTGTVHDCAGEQIKLLGASQKILTEIATHPEWMAGTCVAYVSRTEYPEWAADCLKQFQLADGITMYDLGTYQEIYPGNKMRHFRSIQKASGIPFEDMIFFDNERRNITDCEKLGITCIYTPRGLTAEAWQEGLTKFAAAATRR